MFGVASKALGSGSGSIGSGTPSPALDATSGSDFEGKGAITRSETITISLAAVVLQTLPNGNLAIAGRQEVRVNAELRELQVAGVIRPEDIASDNTIPSNKIAEARISYGGRGTLSDVQQPRYGQQIFDVLFPFLAGGSRATCVCVLVFSSFERLLSIRRDSRPCGASKRSGPGVPIAAPFSAARPLAAQKQPRR